MFGKIRKLFALKEDKAYKCASCDKVHSDWPALAYWEPAYYSMLSDIDKQSKAELTTDFCVINNEEQIDRFVRGVLLQKVNDACEELNYGLWVSLSEKSFENYKANFNNENHEAVYFGWLSNTLEGYENTLGIPCNVIAKAGGSRPEIIPHEGFDHAFVADYYNGIAMSEAEERVKNMITKSVR